MFARVKVLHLCWLIFFVTLPLSKGLNSVAAVALIALTLWFTPWQAWKKNLATYRHVTFITLIFGVLVLAMLYTENQSNGWRYIRHQHRFLILPLAALGCAGLLQQHFKTYLKYFAGATALSCFTVLLLYLAPEDFSRTLANSTSLMLDYPENASREMFGLYSPFIDRIQLSGLTAIAILSCFYLISINLKNWLIWLLGLFLLFMMLLMGGRGGQLSLAVALLLYGIFFSIRFIFPKLQKRMGAAAAGLVIGAALLFLFIGVPYLSYKTFSPIGARVEQTKWEIRMLKTGEFKNYDYRHFTTLTRIVAWQNLWQVVEQNPLLGVGTGDYQDALKKAYADDAYEVQVHNHNQYLMVWAMAGIWGLAVFLGVLFFWLYKMRLSGPIFYLAAAFLVFYLVNMLPDAVLNTQVDGAAFCSFLSLIGLQARPSLDKNA